MKRIVVGVDPSPAGAAALTWAVREAVARRLPLVAVRAWLTPVFGLYYPAGSELAEHEPDACVEARTFAEQALAEARAAVPGGAAVDATAQAVMGAPAHVLLETAADDDLVVVGSRGAGALSRVVLGSVSSAVVHHAGARPVVVVPEPAPATAEAPRVLVGVDHSADSHRALQLAGEHARLHGAVLVPVFVQQPALVGTGPGHGPVPDHAVLEASEREALRHAARTAGASGVRIEPEVVVGHPGEALVGLANPQDLLVVGSRGHGAFAGALLGSVSARAVHSATCPVLVVRGR